MLAGGGGVEEAARHRRRSQRRCGVVAAQGPGARRRLQGVAGPRRIGLFCFVYTLHRVLDTVVVRNRMRVPINFVCSRIKFIPSSVSGDASCSGCQLTALMHIFYLMLGSAPFCCCFHIDMLSCLLVFWLCTLVVIFLPNSYKFSLVLNVPFYQVAEFDDLEEDKFLNAVVKVSFKNMSLVIDDALMLVLLSFPYYS